jgi:SAM-dependent methyltransferase
VRIVNPAVRADLDNGRLLRLNVGGGKRRVPGFYNLDLVPLDGVDVVADLNEPLELPDDCVEEIYCRHVLEHVGRFVELLGELHRVVAPGGRIEAVVPHFSNPHGYSDPTHVRFFGLYSFFYFCDEADQPRRKVPSFYSPVRFRVEEVTFNLMQVSLADKLVRALLQPWVNRGVGWQDWYERRLASLLPVSEVKYVLRPVKAGAQAKAA